MQFALPPFEASDVSVLALAASPAEMLGNKYSLLPWNPSFLLSEGAEAPGKSDWSQDPGFLHPFPSPILGMKAETADRCNPNKS